MPRYRIQLLVVAATGAVVGLAGALVIGLVTVAQETRNSNKKQIQIVFLSMVVVLG